MLAKLAQVSGKAPKLLVTVIHFALIASIAAIQDDLRSGRRSYDPMKSYVHNVMIKRLFDKARRKAWGEMLGSPAVQTLIAEQEDLKRRQRKSLSETSALQLQNK